MSDAMPAYAPLAVTPVWARLNDELIRLVAMVPEDKLDWSPKPGLWNFRGILIHIASARDTWMDRVGVGEPVESVWATVRTPADLQRAYARTWERMSGFLTDAGRLAKIYENASVDPPETFDGNWIAFHVLEHDIHHRADIFHYLALLGIETPGVGTP